jgi:hypothetical protein
MKAPFCGSPTPTSRLRSGTPSIPGNFCDVSWHSTDPAGRLSLCLFIGAWPTSFETLPALWSLDQDARLGGWKKVNWRDSVANLAEAYNRARSDDEKEARILGVSLGSARLAKRQAFGFGNVGRDEPRQI